MTYKLQFFEAALREWRKLPAPLQVQFKRKLRERLHDPCVVADGVRGMQNVYKIKLKSFGYRLVYKVERGKCIVCVIAVGKRDKKSIYRVAMQRHKKGHEA